MDVKKNSLLLHERLKGKIEVKPRVKIRTMEDLSVAYTPGVAEPCLAIANDVSLSYLYTRRHNLVAVITDGTAILGLGDIGPEAGMPVMEGKALLFKTFGDVDAIPLGLKTKDTDEIVKTIQTIACSFGGINLEDIAAPRCFEIENRLRQTLDIPVFHDDQHGTAIVVAAALINAIKLSGRQPDQLRVVINGAGAAGITISKFIPQFGIKHITVCDKLGILSPDDSRLNHYQHEVALKTNPEGIQGTLADALQNADVFIGVSGPHCVNKEMIRSMDPYPIVFSMANPIPEIAYEDAKDAGAFIVGTGSSKYPNQINNVLAFPGIFRGALDVNASEINLDMMKAAAVALANSVPEKELSPTNIIPQAIQLSVHQAVASAVKRAAVATNVARVQ